MKRVLVACEYSQAVTTELRRQGIEAYSCDIAPCLGPYPEWHFQQDVTPLLAQQWDAIIAFPPCTHLAASGARWWPEKQADGRQQAGIDFFMQFASITTIPVAIENPVGIMSTLWRTPDTIIHPWQFGDPYSKTTCLWLNNLPPLQPTQIVDKGEFVVHGGRRIPKWYSNRERNRNTTFPGIAKAMADQWSNLI